MLGLARTFCVGRLAHASSGLLSTPFVGRVYFVGSRPYSTTISGPRIKRSQPWSLHNRATSSRLNIGMSARDFGGQDVDNRSENTRPRPRVPVSSITGLGQGLGQSELQALSKELQAAAKGEELVYPFTSKVYDSANTALFYAQNGRLDVALQSLQAGSELVSCELKRIDEAASRDGVRQERVSNCLENLVKAKAFVHFLQTGNLIRRANVGGEIEDSEYLGAVMRLTSELSSYAITQASVLDRNSILACASLCHALFGELVEFDFRNGPLRKKFDGVKYDVRKIDDILYELSLVGEGESSEIGSRKRDRDDDEFAAEERRMDGEVLNKEEFDVMRGVLTEFDEKRESVIKRTRDVQKWSKMAIYSLHRKDFKRAQKQVSDCRKVAEDLLPLIMETPRLRMGSFASCMEEYAEARLYQLWLQHKRLGARSEVGLVNTEEYLGGLLDLTGELNRYAVARATERDTAGVKECLETVLVIHEFVTLNNLPGRQLSKKRGELNATLRKLQNMTYELALMKAGKGKVAGVSGIDDEVLPSAQGVGSKDEEH